MQREGIEGFKRDLVIGKRKRHSISVLLSNGKRQLVYTISSYKKILKIDPFAKIVPRVK